MVNTSGIGIVVIGRNEGDRLKRCLHSVVSYLGQTVYVDSGSTDGSIELASSLGVRICELDISIPFTAARARNAGRKILESINPEIRYIQFIDGDCEIEPEWIDAAADFLSRRKDVGVVCGRLRERYPDKSIYNMMCDIEWETPIGNSKSCGGNAMYDAAVFDQAGGFNSQLIAGEEPELCLRIRNAESNVWRLDHDMGWHDANLTKFSQWWRRAIRGGHAFAEGSYFHGSTPEKHWVKETRSAVLWGGALPFSVLILILFSGNWALLLLLLYPLQILRITIKGDRSIKINFLWAFFLILGKIPEFLGVLKFKFNKLTGINATLIEYK